MIQILRYICICQIFDNGNPNKYSFRTFLAAYLAGSVSMISFWCLCYLIWVQVLHLPYPVPLIGKHDICMTLSAPSSRICMLCTSPTLSLLLVSMIWVQDLHALHIPYPGLFIGKHELGPDSAPPVPCPFYC